MGSVVLIVNLVFNHPANPVRLFDSSSRFSFPIINGENAGRGGSGRDLGFEVPFRPGEFEGVEAFELFEAFDEFNGFWGVELGELFELEVLEALKGLKKLKGERLALRTETGVVFARGGGLAGGDTTAGVVAVLVTGAGVLVGAAIATTAGNGIVGTDGGEAVEDLVGKGVVEIKGWNGVRFKEGRVGK